MSCQWHRVAKVQALKEHLQRSIESVTISDVNQQDQSTSAEPARACTIEVSPTGFTV